MRGICTRVFALLFLAACINTHLACYTLYERAAAAQKIQKKIQALHARTSPLLPSEGQDLLCDITDALSLGVRFPALWELLGRALLAAARDKKDQQAARLLVTICGGQGDSSSLMCAAGDGSMVPKKRQSFVMAPSVCTDAEELFKSLRFSPAFQKKFSAFEEHLRALIKK